MPHIISPKNQNLIGFSKPVSSISPIIIHCEQQWNIRVSDPFPNLSYNYAAPAYDENGRQLVLKISNLPTINTKREIAALRHYDGDGAVKLIAFDLAHGALLLERAMPGTTAAALTPENDDEATRIAAKLMRQLWKPITAPHPFPTVAEWGKAFARLRQNHGGGTGPLPASLFARAEGLFAELCGEMDESVLLHGDLHHYNIVTAERQAWLAIDPQGVIGEPAYEAGALLRNPLNSHKWPDMRRRLQRRLDILSEQLDLDRPRLQNWGMAQAMLSACWNMEDGTHDCVHWIAVAEALSTVN